MTLTYYPATARGTSDFGWLDSRHSFSFGHYHNPTMMGFGPLRVINDDRVEGGQGFGAHPHRDVEIISYVVQGALEHKDSMGTGSVIRQGDVQIMSAGSGVTHSEFNASASEPVRFLQIWVHPTAKGLTPRYAQRHFPLDARQGTFVKMIAPEAQADDTVLPIRGDATLWGGTFAPGQQGHLSLPPGRRLWVQVVRGQVRVEGQTLEEGDGLALEQTQELTVAGGEAPGEVLVFDLPA